MHSLPWKAGKRAYRKKGHKERRDGGAQNDEPTLDNLQESDGDTHREKKPEGDETPADGSGADGMVVDASGASNDDIEVNDIVSGHGIDRMAIDYLVN
ncbi:hypothetical protein PG991_002929 [Apiospora marii]|uniref:Uncharacterized protein n=1 Tax=Apiospora marii TaxID=335849 RepID=A0ABR1SI22_9PEZI